MCKTWILKTIEHRHIKKDLNKLRDAQCSQCPWTGKLNIAKTVPSKLINRLNTILIKTSVDFSELDNLRMKLIGKYKGPD